MSQAPYPNQPGQAPPAGAPIPYAVPVGQFGGGFPPPGPPGPQRPVGVVVVAVLGIIIGLILLLGGAVTLVAVLVAPGANPLFHDPTIFFASAVDGVLRIVAGGALLASCIGAFTLRPWARRWMILGATVLTLLTIADIVVTVAWVVPFLENHQRSYGVGRLAEPDALMTLGVVKWVLGIGYAAAVFVVLNMKPAKDAFSSNRPQPATPGGYPPQGYAQGYPGYPPATPGAAGPGTGIGPEAG